MNKGVKMLQKIFILVGFLLLFQPAFASQNLAKENEIQTRIDNVGTKILNMNKIQKPIVFTYSTESKKKLLSTDKTITKRQIILYNDAYKSIQSDDELAAFLSREIATATKSYSGVWGGRIDSLQVATSTKKFEIYADKRAVDYMVNAGYNPLGLITYINKTCPQKRSDFISKYNLKSKRLAKIYEYITYKYPKYLSNNTYINNPQYQNFLLHSVENRRLLEDKIKNNGKGELKYE